MKKNDLSIIIDDVKLNVRVGAILKFKDKVLIETGKKEDFSVIPGGRIKTLENSYQALIREIKEELGIDISFEKYKFISLIESFFKFNNQKYHELYFVYKINLTKDYGIFDGMENLDGFSSNYYYKTMKEITKTQILPKELKELMFTEEFKHYIINN